MEAEELKEVLRLHSEWLQDNSKGKYADLRRADLQYADLRNADLRYADLQGANLQNANLQYADLQNVKVFIGWKLIKE